MDASSQGRLTPKQIRDTRQRMGLPIWRLAVLLDCSPHTVWRLEKGRIEPKDEHEEILRGLRLVRVQKPKVAVRVKKLLASSGRLPALSLLLRSMHLQH